MAKKINKKRPFKRKIHLDDQEWSWRMGKGFYIYVMNPECTKVHKVDWTSILQHPADIERIRNYRCQDVPGDPGIEVKPSYIRDWLIRNKDRKEVFK
jgi:hypothetical protein